MRSEVTEPVKCLPLILALCAAVSCGAQTPCLPGSLDSTASRVRDIQKELEKVPVGEMDTTVPVAARDLLTQLKDALTCASDAALAHAGASVDPAELQKRMADALNANPPEPPANTVVPKDDHRFDEAFGSYGHNLRVRVTRPSGVAGHTEVEFSINVECGNDHMLLAYAFRTGTWRRQMRWQASLLKKVSDAYGDFFIYTTLPTPEEKDSGLWIVVAHGTPWCTSRFSGFAIDIITPASDPNSAEVLWHTAGGYSRGDFEPKLISSGDTFELQLNEATMDIMVYERRIIYRYRIDDHQRVHRIQPIATNPRGFVEEWLSAPWSESQSFSAGEARRALQPVHEQLAMRSSSDTKFINYSYGPVTACKIPGDIQVQINSTLEINVPGKPNGESRQLPSHYFQVRKVADGYLMISARTEPDPACTGANLMPTDGE